MTFTIYADRLPEVHKRLERLAKKAARYSVPFDVVIGETHPQEVTVYDVDPVTKTQSKGASYIVEAVDLEILCEGFIKSAGWTVRAKCEHGDNGHNVVTAFGDKPAEEAWYTAPSKCDHCRTNRFRSVTYFVENEQGVVRQVGRACLHEYTGINPATAAMWAEVTALCSEERDLSADEFLCRRLAPMYPVDEILAHACDTVKKLGYRKSEERQSTKELVLELVRKNAEPSAEGKAKAKRIADWLLSLEGRDDYQMSGCEHDALSLVHAEYAKASHFGYLAYMPVAYERYLEWEERQAARKAEAEAAKSSEYVGTIGERITIQAASLRVITSWETQFGTTFLYKITDAANNVFIWKASGLLWDSKGRRCYDDAKNVKLRVTIKDHNERDGVKQTVVTRCALA